MATERQSPDVLIVQTNLTGAVTDIDEDPDSPGADWLTYITNNVDTVTRVSFPTPTGNPTVGADLQEFKIWVRKQNGTGTPTVAISLYENGVLVTELMAATNVTNSSGEIFSVTWNANLLGTADGSLVELYIYGDAVGGAPSARATVEIGAVEWNVTYDVASDFTYTGSGSFTFSGTAIQVYTKNFLYTASGSFIYSGNAVQSYTGDFSYTASGNLTFNGAGIYSVGFSHIGSGTLAYSGIAEIILGFAYIVSGNYVFNGTAIQNYTKNFLFVASGQILYSGNATYSYETGTSENISVVLIN